MQLKQLGFLDYTICINTVHFISFCYIEKRKYILCIFKIYNFNFLFKIHIL